MSRSGIIIASPPVDQSPEQPAFIPYEHRLDLDPRWALSEGSRHFDEDSAVFAALRKITQRLNDLEIPYAVVGGMALFRHGFRRFTEDVDILVTREGLKKIHASLEGLGYLPAHRHSKHLRDTQLGVRIEFLIAGEYPGDGRPKAVFFPEPEPVSFEADGIRYLNLIPLLELKLASGMTNPGRLKDLADVLEVIKGLDLPESLASELDASVREKYLELWHEGRRRYVRLWSRTDLSGRDREAMLRDGFTVEDEGSDSGQVRMVTTDPELARKYDMVEESEFWQDTKE